MVQWAFDGCEALQEIIIPDSVTAIGDGTFRNCEALQKITIPDSVTAIGNGVFRNCKALQEITIPERYSSIVSEVLSCCPNLKTLKAGNRDCSFVLKYKDQKNFSDISNMVLTKDFSTKMPSTVKVPFMVDWYSCEPEDAEVTAYIKKKFRKIFTTLLDENHMEKIRTLIDSGKFLTKRNIDGLIKLTIEKKAHEIQILLTDYKAEKFKL
ncbi:MAG: leucine-rich repeat domain-containing protein [Ruminococcus sp.]|nr:leucine-rich repeat domain-containing protein [Ruminococcus sp.]